MNQYVRSGPPETADDPCEAPLSSGSTAVVLFEPPSLPASVDPPITNDDIDQELQEVMAFRNVRHISPRDMAELALDLYAIGCLAWDEYSMLAFQSELQPAYNRTIGALTGQKAEPDRPRDYIAKWEKRLAFEIKHSPRNRALIKRTKWILEFLRGLERPLKLVS